MNLLLLRAVDMTDDKIVAYENFNSSLKNDDGGWTHTLVEDIAVGEPVIYPGPYIRGDHLHQYSKDICIGLDVNMIPIYINDIVATMEETISHGDCSIEGVIEIDHDFQIYIDIDYKGECISFFDVIEMGILVIGNIYNGYYNEWLDKHAL